MTYKYNILKLTFTAIIISVFFTSSLIAQEKKIAFEKYGVAEGLPEEFVTSMVQDDQGFMWLTTQNGLVKFDGYTMKVYKGTTFTPGSKKLAFSSVSGGVLKARNGNLWIGSVLEDGGIASFDPKTELFRNYMANPKDTTSIPFQNSRLLFEDHNNHIWFSNNSYNLDTTVIARLNPKTQLTKTYPYTPRRKYNDIITTGDILNSDADKNVWLRDKSGNVLVLNREKDEFEEVIATGTEIPGSGIKDTIRAITSGGKDYFLMSGDHNLFIWDPIKKESIKHYSNLTDKDNKLSNINYAFKDLSGQYWVVHMDNKITLINPVKNTTTNLTYGKGPLNFAKSLKQTLRGLFPIHQNQNGVWFQIFTENSDAFIYYKFSTKSFTYYNHQFNDTKNPIPKFGGLYNALYDNTGLLWLYTRPNFYKQSPKSGQIELIKHNDKEKNSIPSDTISSLFEDSKNRLWVGTQSGLSVKLEDDSFKQIYYKNTEGIQSGLGDIRIIYEDSKGKIWVSTRSYGLLTLNENTQEFDRLNFNLVTSIQEDRKGNIWISSYNNSVYVLDGNTTKVITEFKKNTKDTHGLLSNQITEIFLDSRGSMWLGDRGDNQFGLFNYIEKDQRFKHYKRDAVDALTLNSNEIGTIIEDDRNRMWVATDGGVNLYDHEKDVFYKTNESFDIASASTIVKATDGKIWAATYASGGLALIGPNIQNIEMFGEDKGLLHNDISNPILDDYGKLWLPTERGLSVLDTLTKTFLSYSEKDGFQKPSRRYITQKTSDGIIWIGGSNGLNRIDPSQLFKKDSIPPQVLITAVGILDSLYASPDGKLFKKAVSYTDKVVLDYSQKDLSFEFVALHYLRSEDNQYSWKLENYDKNWSVPSKETRAAYTNLAPGNYTFKVKAANADGIWNEEGASITIIINSPWWFTWWAYLIYALIALLIGLKIHKTQRERTLRLEREKAQKKELEQAKEIEKAYMDLKSTQTQLIHAEKMASLGELTAGIAHEIQNPLNFVNNFSEVNQELVDELIEELDKGDIEESKTIALDIKTNEEKINHHGNRADSIVKGMLKHSRNHTGEKLLTNINVLCDEYLRLAYHGLRAKDKSFNATLKTDFDEKVDEILVVPQEIGRVVLNIINNGLFAVKEKQDATKDSEFKPTIWISTKELEDKIIITIRDNGNGIPDAIKDKIFLPFFTTKATGDGTGLGLSMSYDIIKAHNGTLEVKTEKGAFTEFTIRLPLTAYLGH